MTALWCEALSGLQMRKGERTGEGVVEGERGVEGRKRKRRRGGREAP